MKPTTPKSEAARLEILRQYDILDTPAEQVFDDLTALAAHTCRSPIALISLVDSDRQWFKSKIGTDISETPRDVAFCAYAIAGQDLLVVHDATQDKRFADNPMVTSEPHIRFYAAAPLVTTDGHALGTLCVMDCVPRALTDEEARVLRTLSRLVVAQMELRRSLQARRLAEKALQQAHHDLETRVRERTAMLSQVVEGLRNEIAERKRAEEALRQRTEQALHHQRVLLTLAKMQPINLTSAMQTISAEDARTLHVERVGIWQFSEDGSEIICRSLYQLGRGTHEAGHRLRACDYPRYFQALRESRTIAADNARRDVRTSEYTDDYLAPLGITSMLDVPIWMHGRVAGVVCHEHVGAQREWSLEEQEFAASIADMVSLAWEADERRQAEARYRGIFENALEGIFQTTPEGRFITANPALARMLGFESPAELVQSVTDISNQLFVDPGQRGDMTRLLEERGQLQGYEIQLYRKDGSRIWVSANVRIVRNARGEIVCFEGIDQDITEQKRAEQEIRLLQTITLAMSEATDLSSALRVVLRKVCEATGWPYGGAWIPSADGTVLEFHSAWHCMGATLAPFETRSEQTRFEPGQGLPGRVWRAKKPAWVRDVRTDSNFPRAPVAQQVGLKAGVAIPVLAGETVVAVIEFLMTEAREEDDRLIKLIAAVASQLGVVVQRKQYQEELERSSTALRALTARVQSVREEEGARIAREVHDQVGQALTGIKMDLTWLEKRLSARQGPATPAKLLGRIRAASNSVDETVAMVQRISSELHPSILDDLGLAAAIEWQIQEFQARTGVRCRLQSELENVRLGRELSTTLFRIFQELLTNVARHARATQVAVELQRRSDQLFLRVHDNGRGIKLADINNPKSLGLLGIRERASLIGGSVHIEGAPRKGTTVTVVVPLVAPAQNTGAA